ncbi:MAG: AAA family ATPase [Coriobacteriaceae bacterium]|nr:AAA family ATPase [Coriobacteriaceae bacterium]
MRFYTVWFVIASERGADAEADGWGTRPTLHGSPVNLGHKIALFPIRSRSPWRRNVTVPASLKHRALADCVAAAVMDAHMGTDALLAAVEDACEGWGAPKIDELSAVEVTYSEWDDLLEGTYDEKNDYFQDLGLIELSSLKMRFNRWFGEKILPEAAPGDALADARKTSYAQALGQELGRVLETNPALRQEGPFVPVDYVIEGTSPATYIPAVDLLSSSLVRAGRVSSRHLFTIDIDNIQSRVSREDTRLLEVVNPALADALDGTTVVIRYGLYDGETSLDAESYGLFTRLVDALVPHLETTQLIFILPPGKAELKRRLESRLYLPLVEISQDSRTSARSLSREGCLARLSAMARDEGLEADGSLGTLLDQRLGDPTFDDLDALFIEWRHARRVQLDFPGYEELVAQRSAEAPAGDGTARTAIQRLDGLIGLTEQKRRIHGLITRAKMNRIVAAQGMDVVPVSLHMAFLGAPGTGKTEVARLYGQILREEGILSEGRVITMSGPELRDVRGAFDAAQGSVLFIDEAYGMPLASITDFVALMEERRRDTVVILAGYKAQMERLLSLNGGFRSRLGMVLEFLDYSAEELEQIFSLMCRRRGLSPAPDALLAVRDVLARGGRRSDQGNARFVRKLFEDTVGAQQLRLAKEGEQAGWTPERLSQITVQDVMTASGMDGTREASGKEELDGLVGLAEVKRVMRERMGFFRIQKVRRDAGQDGTFIPMHMAFLGNPGTGKTEVARIVAKVLREEHVLSVGNFYETDGTRLRVELIPPFFERARGSVVFIDEAYAMIGSGNLIAALIKAMEDYREEVVVILAGYTLEMQTLFASNPGFSSRIQTYVTFSDYTPEQLGQILAHMAERDGFSLAEGVREKADAIIAQAAKEKNFGNARFVRSLYESAVIAQGARLSEKLDGGVEDVTGPNAEALATLLPEDFREPSGNRAANTRSPIGFA